jgi:GDP-4-dehydro-6-deoxy-D-mannose reductase
MNSYAATKAAGDLALGSMVSEGLRVVRLRLFNHTEPGQSEAFVVSAFARQIARIEAGHQLPVIHVGALDSRRAWLDAQNSMDTNA